MADISIDDGARYCYFCERKLSEEEAHNAYDYMHHDTAEKVCCSSCNAFVHANREIFEHVLSLRRGRVEIWPIEEAIRYLQEYKERMEKDIKENLNKTYKEHFFNVDSELHRHLFVGFRTL